MQSAGIKLTATELLSQLINEFGAAIAIGVGLYWAYLLFRRTQSGDDPSMRKSVSSRLGSYSMVTSGAYLSAMFAGAIAFATWPAPVETPFLGVLLAGGVAFHAAMEYRESTA